MTNEVNDSEWHKGALLRAGLGEVRTQSWCALMHAKDHKTWARKCAPHFHNIDQQISCSEQRRECGLHTRTSWHKIVTLREKIVTFALIHHE